jgi:hypothetical protein
MISILHPTLQVLKFSWEVVLSWSLCFDVLYIRLDYLVVPVKVLQSLKDTKTDLEDKYAFVRRLDPSASQFTQFSDDEVTSLFRSLWAFCTASELASICLSLDALLIQQHIKLKWSFTLTSLLHLEWGYCWLFRSAVSLDWWSTWWMSFHIAPGNSTETEDTDVCMMVWLKCWVN